MAEPLSYILAPHLYLKTGPPGLRFVTSGRGSWMGGGLRVGEPGSPSGATSGALRTYGGVRGNHLMPHLHRTNRRKASSPRIGSSSPHKKSRRLSKVGGTRIICPDPSQSPGPRNLHLYSFPRCSSQVWSVGVLYLLSQSFSDFINQRHWKKNLHDSTLSYLSLCEEQ